MGYRRTFFAKIDILQNERDRAMKSNAEASHQVFMADLVNTLPVVYHIPIKPLSLQPKTICGKIWVACNHGKKC